MPKRPEQPDLGPLMAATARIFLVKYSRSPAWDSEMLDNIGWNGLLHYVEEETEKEGYCTATMLTVMHGSFQDFTSSRWLYWPEAGWWRVAEHA